MIEPLTGPLCDAEGFGPAIELYLSAGAGDSLLIRGRKVTPRDGSPGCVSWYFGRDGELVKGEMPVFAERPRGGSHATMVTLRPMTRARLVEHEHNWFLSGRGALPQPPECSTSGGSCTKCVLCGDVEHLWCAIDPHREHRGQGTSARR